MKRASEYLSPQAGRSVTAIKQRHVDEFAEETKEILEELKKNGVEIDRPKKRSDCPGSRPCPYVSCRYHLYLDITNSGSLKINFDNIEPWEMSETCALDVADRGQTRINEIGSLLGVTRERIRQIEYDVYEKLKAKNEKL